MSDRSFQDGIVVGGIVVFAIILIAWVVFSGWPSEYNNSQFCVSHGYQKGYGFSKTINGSSTSYYCCNTLFSPENGSYDDCGYILGGIHP